jgi:hypothetical protein
LAGGNNAGLAAIKDMIRRLRSLSRLDKEVAPAVARELQAWAASNIAAGVGPDGQAWPPKKDGGKALQNAAQALAARAVGTVALLELRAPEVFHHFGAGGKPRRPILPGNIPRKLGDAIRLAAIEGWERLVKKGR